VRVNSEGQLIKIPPARVGLSTTSVYPESTSSAFELARRLGYDGVEIMVGIDPVAADIDAVEKLRDYHEVPVLAIHSPCLLITQRVWGTDPWAKLILFCVENMYPWRTPGGELKAYMPGWDPTDLDYADLTLDLSHASTAGQQSIDLVRSWGSRLRHVHLTDGTGSVKDEHLVPGRGDQRAGRVLQYLAERNFAGHVVLEVNSRKSGTRAQREADLAESLAFARLHLAAPVHPSYAVDAAGIASAL
jgi:sugar phosphate isomerase/epimerase